MSDHEKATSPDSLIRRLAAYLPSLLNRQLLQRGLPPLGQPRSITAATLFADISGFTSMSEELATDGPRGAEELNRVLLRTFTVMIDEIHAQGGVVSHFYGDAMSVYFPETDDAANTAVYRALACAQQLQQQMQRRFGRVLVNRPPGKDSRFALTIKIGVGYGRCQETVVGDRDGCLEFVLTGDAVDQAAQAEHAASANEIVASRSVATHAGLLDGQRDKRPFLRITEAITPPTPRPLLNWDDIDQARLPGWQRLAAPFVPGSLLEHLQASSLGMIDIAEHRPATSLFVQFEFAGDDDPSSTIATTEMGHYLQHYYLWACQLTARFGRENARVNRVLTGDKGNQLHIIFGAPVAPDSPDQALRLALAMQREQPAYVRSQRIGLVAGKVFAGPVGSATRREYTIVGDIVNLSARLMQQAPPGVVITDAATARRVEGVIAFEQLSPVRLKGKQEPVAICRAVSDEATTIRLQAYVGRQERDLVGRENEAALLLGSLDAALRGAGGVAAVRGPTGSGKTRLLVEGVRHWLATGGQGLVGVCHQHTSETPFGPWRAIWRDLFELRLEGEPAAQMARVLSQTRDLLPDSGDDAYLWAEVLGLPGDLPPTIADLPPETRQQRFFRLVRRTVTAAADQQPLLIILENMHWADQASLALLDDLTEHLSGATLFIALTFRPDAPLSLATLERSVCVQIVLSDLAPAEGRKLLNEIIGVFTLPAAAEQQLGLRDREGRDSPVNPLFLEEALRVMQDAGILRVNGRVAVDERMLAHMQVPDTIHGLLLARLDRLTPTSRNLLQIASIIGRQFSLEPLTNLSTGLQRQIMLEMLADLSAEKITRLVAADPEWIYLFQHALTHEVAYESLPYARRRELHAAMADWLVDEHSDNLKPLYPVLAYHYSRADIHEEGLRYALAAANDARAIFANREAVELYGLAEKHLRVLGEASRWETAVDLSLARAECLRFLGDFKRAIRDVEQALNHLAGKDDVERQARTFNLLAELRYRLSQYVETEVAVQTVITDAAQVSPGELARAYQWLGMAQVAQQAYDTAVANLQRAAQICETARDRKRLARVAEGLAFARYMQRDLTEALAEMQRSVTLSREYSTAVNLASSLSNIALVQFQLGQARAALATLNEAVDIVQDASRHFLAQVVSNRAEVQAYLGYFEDSLVDFQHAQRLFSETDDVHGLVDLHVVMGYEYFLALDNSADAERCFQQAESLVGKAPELFADVLPRLFWGQGRIALTQNALTVAEQAFNRATNLVETRADAWWQPVAHYHQALLAARHGRIQEAANHLQTALPLTTADGCPDYRPLILLALADLAGDENEKRRNLLACLSAARDRARWSDRLRCYRQAGQQLAALAEPKGNHYLNLAEAMSGSKKPR